MNKRQASGAVPWFRETELFTSGTDGYHTFRVPALVVAKDGAILAFCEGRKYASSDYGTINLVLRRSLDNGATWEDMQVIAAEGDRKLGNPCAVVDRDTGTVWLAHTNSRDPRGSVQNHRVYVMSSTDSGATWSPSVELTGDVKRPGWPQCSMGPGHGAQLRDGRLIIPCYQARAAEDAAGTSRSFVFYSDDHGESWRRGGLLPEGSGECELVETQGGALYMAVRPTAKGLGKRVCSWSEDGGATWSELEALGDLPDPRCQASIVRFTGGGSHDRDRILFSNVASSTRDTLTARVSYDECKTWAAGKVLYRGPAAYSELAIASDMTICCLYERGTSNPYERLVLAQFNVEWLTDGADSLAAKRR